jgi:hypothetical protein
MVDPMTQVKTAQERPEKLLDAVYRQLAQSGDVEQVLDPVRVWIGARWAQFRGRNQVPPAVVWTRLGHGRGWSIESAAMTARQAPSDSKVLALSFSQGPILLFGWPTSAGPIAEHAAVRLSEIAPDLVQVVAVMSTLKGMADASTDPKSVIEAISRPLGLLKGNGQVTGWNHSAFMLASKAGVPLPPVGSIAWASECRKAVRHGAASYDLGQGLVVNLAGMGAGTHTSSSVMGAYMLSTVLAIFAFDTTEAEIANGVTAAEKAVFEHLQAGLSVSDIAAVRGTSIETVRQQIKRLRAKLGRHSIAGLAGIE